MSAERLHYSSEALADMVEAVERFDYSKLVAIASHAKWTLAPLGYQWNDNERRFTQRPEAPPVTTEGIF